MSTKISDRVWDNKDTKGSVRLVLLSLADNANDYGYCWPGLRYTKDRTCLSRRQIQRIFAELIKNGMLYSHGGDAYDATNKYIVLVGQSATDTHIALTKFIGLSDTESNLAYSQILQCRHKFAEEKATLKKPRKSRSDKMSPGDIVTFKSADPSLIDNTGVPVLSSRDLIFDAFAAMLKATDPTILKTKAGLAGKFKKNWLEVVPDDKRDCAAEFTLWLDKRINGLASSLKDMDKFKAYIGEWVSSGTAPDRPILFGKPAPTTILDDPRYEYDPNGVLVLKGRK